MVIKVTEVKLSCQEFYRLTFLKSLPQKKIVIIDKYILAQCWSHKNFREIAMVQNWKKKITENQKDKHLSYPCQYV